MKIDDHSLILLYFALIMIAFPSLIFNDGKAKC